MAAVELQFLPPSDDNVITLHVEEAPAPGGTYGEIQTFPAGTYPDYITRADVTNATNAADWFRIRWEDAVGNFTPYSAPIQGGTTTVVAQVMDRVLLRDPGVNPLIVGQESEASVAEYFGTPDPYSVDPSLATPKILSGLTLMTLARVYINRLVVATQAKKWSAGLVSMDVSNSAQSWDAVNKMIELANRELDRNYSVVLLLDEISVAGGLKQLKSYDVSRALIELA